MIPLDRVPNNYGVAFVPLVVCFSWDSVNYVQQDSAVLLAVVNHPVVIDSLSPPNLVSGLDAEVIQVGCAGDA